MSILSLFPSQVRIADANGFATPEFLRALSVVFQRVGGTLGDGGADVFATGPQEPSAALEMHQQAALGDESFAHEVIMQPMPGAEAWPIGSIFISVATTNPARLLGYGTWVSFGPGAALVGLSGGDPDFGALEATGGAKTKPISAHSVSTAGFGAGGGLAVTSIGNHTDLNVVQPFIVVNFWKRTA